MRASVGGRLRGDGTRRELGYARERRLEAEAADRRREEAS
jgi:hypothetical protein